MRTLAMVAALVAISTVAAAQNIVPTPAHVAPPARLPSAPPAPAPALPSISLPKAILPTPAPAPKVAPAVAAPKAAPAPVAAKAAPPVQVAPPCQKHGDCPDPQQAEFNERARRKFAQCQSEAKGNREAMDKCLFGVLSPAQLAALKRCLGQDTPGAAITAPDQATLSYCLKVTYAAK